LDTDIFECETRSAAHEGLLPNKQTFQLRPKINEEKEFSY